MGGVRRDSGADMSRRGGESRGVSARRGSRRRSGLVLASKRLEQGRFAWPSVRDGVMRLSRARFEALFERLDWRRMWRPAVRRPLTTG